MLALSLPPLQEISLGLETHTLDASAPTRSLSRQTTCLHLLFQPLLLEVIHELPRGLSLLLNSRGPLTGYLGLAALFKRTQESNRGRKAKGKRVSHWLQPVRPREKDCLPARARVFAHTSEWGAGAQNPVTGPPSLALTRSFVLKHTLATQRAM